MSARDLHVGDERVLAVVVLDHVGVARAQATLGAGRQAGAAWAAGRPVPARLAITSSSPRPGW